MPTEASRWAWRGWAVSPRCERAQGGDDHRAFALAVDLHEARAHHANRPLDVGGVHGCAAVHDGLEAGAVGAGIFRVIHQSLDDGGGGEHRQPANRPRQIEDLGGIEGARCRHHMARAGHDVRNGVDAGAMRHGCAVDNRVAWVDGVHVDKIGQAHGHQVAMAEHHALGLARGSAGIEQPGQVLRSACRDRRRWQGEQRFVVGAQGIDGAIGRVQALAHVRCDERPACLRVVKDPLRLAQVQLGVHRDHRESGPPGAVHKLEIGRMVAHVQRNAIAGLQAGGPERRGQAPRPVRQSAVVAQQARAFEHRRTARIGQCDALQ